VKFINFNCYFVLMDFILFAAFKSVSLNFPSNFSANDIQILAEFNASMNRRVVNLEELYVNIAKVDTADHLIGFFTSCKNIKKFTLGTWPMDDTDLLRIFRTILPIFNQLEELVTQLDEHNYDDNQDLNEMFDVISSSCPNLRKLGVPNLLMENAKNYFHNSNIIIFTYENTIFTYENLISIYENLSIYSSVYPESD
jgi:hypothetical protein